MATDLGIFNTSQLVEGFNSLVSSEEEKLAPRNQRKSKLIEACEQKDKETQGKLRSFLVAKFGTQVSNEVSEAEKQDAEAVKKDKAPRKPTNKRKHLNDDKIIRVLSPVNPKREGTDTHKRWELYRDRMTVAEARIALRKYAAGDIAWDSDSGRNHIRVVDPGSPEASAPVEELRQKYPPQLVKRGKSKKVTKEAETEAQTSA